jgi:hypothetical protein
MSLVASPGCGPYAAPRQAKLGASSAERSNTFERRASLRRPKAVVVLRTRLKNLFA